MIIIYCLHTQTQKRPKKSIHLQGACNQSLFFLAKLGLCVTLTVVITKNTNTSIHLQGLQQAIFFVGKLRGVTQWHKNTLTYKQKTQSILMRRRELSPSGYAFQIVICFLLQCRINHLLFVILDSGKPLFEMCCFYISHCPNSSRPLPPPSVKQANVEKSASNHPGKPLQQPPSPFRAMPIWKQNISKSGFS